MAQAANEQGEVGGEGPGRAAPGAPPVAPALLLCLHATGVQSTSRRRPIQSDEGGVDGPSPHWKAPRKLPGTRPKSIALLLTTPLCSLTPVPSQRGVSPAPGACPSPLAPTHAMMVMWCPRSGVAQFPQRPPRLSLVPRPQVRGRRCEADGGGGGGERPLGGGRLDGAGQRAGGLVCRV